MPATKARIIAMPISFALMATELCHPSAFREISGRENPLEKHHHKGLLDHTKDVMSALVIENDPLQLALFERVLIDLGVRVSSATNFGPKVADLIMETQLDLALLDFELGAGPNGIDVAKFIRASSPRTTLVLISSFVDIWDGPDDSNRRLFSQVIHKKDVVSIEQFGMLLAPIIKGQFGQVRTNQADQKISRRALQIWKLVSMGHTNSEISQQVGLSVKSVEKTISQLSLSLGISHTAGNLRVQLVRKYVERNGQLPNR
jgi:DNA-binding NarL/FixJ family response regulator